MKITLQPLLGPLRRRLGQGTGPEIQGAGEQAAHRDAIRSGGRDGDQRVLARPADGPGINDCSGRAEAGDKAVRASGAAQAL